MSGKVWNYVYNSENQMTEAHYFEGPSKLKSVSFGYDALGRRVKKAVEDFQTGNTYARKYAYDSNEIIAELDEDNNVLATYTHSGLRTDDVLSAEITSSGVAKGLAQVAGTYMYLKDGLGSVQAITTESGQLVQRYIYSSFGKLLKIVDAIGLETTAIKTAFTYTNREIDEETGLYYYRARYYDAHSGRFMQEDPHPGKLRYPITSMNKYSYASNGPLQFIDPSGEFIIAAILAVALKGALIGATIGFTASLLNNNFDLGLAFQAAAGGAAIGAGAALGGALAGAMLAGGGIGGGLLLFGKALGAGLGAGVFAVNFRVSSFEEGFYGGFVGQFLGDVYELFVGTANAPTTNPYNKNYRSKPKDTLNFKLPVPQLD